MRAAPFFPGGAIRKAGQIHRDAAATKHGPFLGADLATSFNQVRSLSHSSREFPRAAAVQPGRLAHGQLNRAYLEKIPVAYQIPFEPRFMS